ncbi:MAG: SEC-C domain-containing protein [Synergistales bacterium]|nr:SEC-C domain-containing protein [Synergistales bacterium]
MLSRAIENAQKKVEQMHFDIRRQLLMYDNVLSQQREAIYTERRRVLLEEGVTDRAWEVVEDAVNGILEDAYPEEGEAEPHSAQVRLKSIFWPGLEKHLDGVDSAKLLPPAREAIFDELRRRFDGRIAEMGEVMAEEVARAVILHVMDARWKEHLLAMDELRRGIGLRAIGQKDPLLEYQFESYNLFQEMLTKVREGVSEMLFRVNVVSESEEEHPGPQLNEGREMALPGKQEKQGAKQEQSRPQQQVRKGPKVGRNDPCPCGSGKKYKHCCGKVK